MVPSNCIRRMCCGAGFPSESSADGGNQMASAMDQSVASADVLDMVYFRSDRWNLRFFELQKKEKNDHVFTGQ